MLLISFFFLNRMQMKQAKSVPEYPMYRMFNFGVNSRIEYRTIFVTFYALQSKRSRKSEVWEMK